jgi:hypothetical protein
MHPHKPRASEQLAMLPRAESRQLTASCTSALDMKCNISNYHQLPSICSCTQLDSTCSTNLPCAPVYLCQTRCLSSEVRCHRLEWCASDAVPCGRGSGGEDWDLGGRGLCMGAIKTDEAGQRDWEGNEEMSTLQGREVGRW